MNLEDLKDPAGADPLKLREAIDRIIDPPIVQAVREILDHIKPFELPQPTGFAETLKATQAAHDTVLAAVRPFELPPIGVAPLRLKPLDIFDARPIGFPDFGAQFRELSTPLGQLAASIQQQEEAIARSLRGFDQDQWTPFRRATQIALQHYQRLAEANALAGSALAMVQAIEQDEPEKPPTPDAIDALVAALVALIVGLAQRTKRRAGKLDLFDIVCLIAAIQAVLPSLTAQAAESGQQIVERLKEGVRDVAAAQSAELERVNSLPRSVAVGAGRVREKPSVHAKIRTRLANGTVVAIAGRSGRWRRIIYRDNLSGDLAQGWIWSESLRDP